MNLFSKYLMPLWGGVMLCLSAGPIEAAQSLDRAVVTVNGVPITARIVEEEMAFIKKHQPKSAVVTQGMVLKGLIMQELMLQVAQRSGVEVNSREMDQRVEYALQSGSIPQELAKDKKRLKKQMIISSIQSSLSMGAEQLASEEEIKEQMENIPAQLQQELPVQFHLETLVIPRENAQPRRFVPYPFAGKIFRGCQLWRSLKGNKSAEKQKSTDQLMKEVAEQALVQAKAGMSFKAIAKKQKRKPALKAEDISRTSDKLPTAYRDALKNLNPGDIAGPFEFYNGLHLIRLNKAVGPAILRARHLLLRVSLDADDEQVKQKIEAIRQRALEDNTAFAQQAEQYSEDLETVFKGGDLGWVMPETLDKAFATALDTLKPGEVSLPFKTAEGWHIVQLTDRQFFTPDHPEWKRYIAKYLVEEKKTMAMVEDRQKELYRSAHIQWIEPAYEKMV